METCVSREGCQVDGHNKAVLTSNFPKHATQGVNSWPRTAPTITERGQSILDAAALCRDQDAREGIKRCGVQLFVKPDIFVSNGHLVVRT